jgi:hypothetical protein
VTMGKKNHSPPRTLSIRKARAPAFGNIPVELRSDRDGQAARRHTCIGIGRRGLALAYSLVK